jgi:GST-like protein
LSGKAVPKARSKPIELHFWPTPNGLKISIMLEECRLPYEVRPVVISKGDQFRPEFLAISPNNRIPGIVDPDGPGGRPISVFESGAILQYLGRKTGKFYPAGRAGVEVDAWLFWQAANVGPVFGQVNHFRNYSQTKVEYAIDRFVNEAHRLYGVMEVRLSDRDFLAGRYSIADIATWPWARSYERRAVDIAEFPNVKAWLARVGSRPGVAKGAKVGEDLRAPDYDLGKDLEAHKILFGQRARR